jgi:inorganic pyrophosphatase
MGDLSRLPHQLNREALQCRAIIETPRGSRIKFKFEPDSGMFEISKFLPKGFVFPFEFGFVPSTVAEDGDPLDIVVLMDEPAHVGCLLQVRILGAIRLVQTENGKDTFDPRVIGVPLQSVDYAGLRTIEDLQRNVRDQIVEFFELYNKNTPKWDKVTGFANPQEAVALIEESSARFAESAKS